MGCILDTWLRSASVPLDIYRRAEERSRAEYSGIAAGGGDDGGGVGDVMNTCLMSASLSPDIYTAAEERSRAEYSGIAAGGDDGGYDKYMSKGCLFITRHP